MLRVWRAAEATWQASLEDPHTGERRAFASLTQLVAFLEVPTDASRSGAPTARHDPEAPKSSDPSSAAL
jgi:hypothetical protein